jgi:hypothetical protein
MVYAFYTLSGITLTTMGQAKDSSEHGRMQMFLLMDMGVLVVNINLLSSL